MDESFKSRNKFLFCQVYNILHEIIYYCMQFCEVVMSGNEFWDSQSQHQEKVSEISKVRNFVCFYNHDHSLVFTYLIQNNSFYLSLSVTYFV